MTKRILLAITFLMLIGQLSYGQAIQLMGRNVLNGVAQGLALGAAGMAVADNDNLDPLRIGLGAGILYGVGVGVYDINSSNGKYLLVQGTFNNGTNTSIITLLDTAYGAAAGVILASATMLIANESLVDGLQYGAGIGAFAGFGFGLVDAFVLSERMPTESSVAALNYTANGFVAYRPSQNVSFGFVEPTVMNRLDFDSSTLQVRSAFGVHLLNMSFRF